MRFLVSVYLLSSAIYTWTLEPKESFHENQYQHKLVSKQIEAIFDNYFLLLDLLKTESFVEKKLTNLFRDFLEKNHAMHWHCQRKKSKDDCTQVIEQLSKVTFELDIAFLHFLAQSLQKDNFRPNLIYYRSFPLLSLNLMSLYQKTLHALHLKNTDQIFDAAITLSYDSVKIKSQIKYFYKGLVQSQKIIFIDLFWDFFVNDFLSYSSAEFDHKGFINKLDKSNKILNDLNYTCDKLLKENQTSESNPICKSLMRQWNSILKIVLKRSN